MHDYEDYNTSAAWGFAVLMMVAIVAILSFAMKKDVPADSEPVPEVVEEVDKTSECMVNFHKKFAVELTKGAPLKRPLSENEIKTLHSIATYECILKESEK